MKMFTPLFNRLVGYKALGYKQLSKYHSNLGNDGFIELYCPHCYKSWVAGHLCWSAFKCTNCKEFVDKTDYLIKENK
tara:strand:+ start:464 stop:694 length:231 start_codon:yes stop_codon:yes gene_type:complete